MKKVFDQTVRDLKREVNKKVLKVPGIEQKILDATSNEPWGPHGSLLAEIAQATHNYHEYQMVMNVVWKRINDTGKNWRHIYKGLIVLDYLVAHGTERVIDDIREHSYQISTLADFQYIDSSGRDQGSNVRRKSQSLVSLVNDKERIQEVRQKALATKDKYRSAFATSGTHRGTGGYGGYDNDRHEGSYGSRYDNRNGYGGEREYGYRDDDRYGGAGSTPNQEGDRYSRDSNERYGRDRDDEYKGSHSNHEYAEGSGRRSYGQERDSYGDDEAYSSRGRGSNADGPTQDERSIEQKPSNQQITSQETSQDNVHNERNGGTVPVPVVAPKVSSPSAPAISVSLDQVNGVHDITVEDVPAPPPAHAEANGFDEFDPRGSVPDALPLVSPSPAVNNLEMDLFGSDPTSVLALVSVPQSIATLNVAPSANSGFETNSFMGMPPTSTGFSEPIDASNPFGDPTPFKAVHEETPAISQTNAALLVLSMLLDLVQQDIFASTASLPSVVSPTNPSVLPQQAVPSYVSSQTIAAPFAPSQMPQPVVSNLLSAPINLQLSQPTAMATPQATPISRGASQPLAVPNSMPSGANFQLHSSSPAPPETIISTLQVSQPEPVKKFEPKSTVWADTLSRGLVNLNISGPKANPHSDIGVDFDSLNRKEKRQEKKTSQAPVVSTITMGKAMGSGSGIGRAGWSISTLFAFSVLILYLI
ncbi:hypothetical protein GUJ93_ZPchr0002g26526 [Zizania palustris]|uniref:ENTH domain-containing protein n=1 Tax=Zizania palustris TaxID=103762 RepID=A0A8J5SPZ2_ZIZPA|nr:hypothetical protein GUJ93_ZPchr0002g26526 [Zizania palustris]